MTAPLAISVEETAKRIGMSPWSVYAAIRRGDIPSRKIGARILIPIAELERMFGVDEPAEVES